MDIYIVTLNGLYNFGNRLQNYALQEVLKNCGYNSLTLNINNDFPDEINEIFRWIVWKLKEPKKVILKKLVKKLYLKYKNKSNLEIKKKSSVYELRKESFRKFNSEYINFYEENINAWDINYIQMKLSGIFVIGSDQVWNPNFSDPRVYLLPTIAGEKKISYAASFGVSNIDEIYKQIFKEKLSEMKFISVREKNGADLVRSLTGKCDTHVHVDPTLLLSRKEWMQIIENPSSKPDEPYAVTFFLSNVYDLFCDDISEIIDQHNMIKHDISDFTLSQNNRIGPAEFLSLINSASFVFTDSFHATVFSILFETPFLVFQRRDSNGNYVMSSRIDTLLGKFGFQDRFIVNKFIRKQNLFAINFSHVTSILDNEKRKSIEYLEYALSESLKPKYN